MGRPEVVGADWIKPGATVIDVGINFVADPSKPDGMRLCGDVDFESVRQVAGAITPVPGGVGPMTVATLMRVRGRRGKRGRGGKHSLPRYHTVRVLLTRQLPLPGLSEYAAQCRANARSGGGLAVG